MRPLIYFRPKLIYFVNYMLTLDILVQSLEAILKNGCHIEFFEWPAPFSKRVTLREYFCQISCLCHQVNDSDEKCH